MLFDVGRIRSAMQQHGVPRTELFPQNEIADALHEETNFADIAAKTSLHPDEFPDAVFAGRDYPCDGSEAEKDPDIHKI